MMRVIQQYITYLRSLNLFLDGMMTHEKKKTFCLDENRPVTVLCQKFFQSWVTRKTW